MFRSGVKRRSQIFYQELEIERILPATQLDQVKIDGVIKFHSGHRGWEEEHGADL